MEVEPPKHSSEIQEEDVVEEFSTTAVVDGEEVKVDIEPAEEQCEQSNSRTNVSSRVVDGVSETSVEFISSSSGTELDIQYQIPAGVIAQNAENATQLQQQVSAEQQAMTLRNLELILPSIQASRSSINKPAIRRKNRLSQSQVLDNLMQVIMTFKELQGR